MSTACTLRIRTKKFKLELEGSEEFVRASYTAVRDEVLQNLEHTLNRPVVEAASASPRRPAKAPAAVQSDPQPPHVYSEQEANHYVWVYQCGRLYNKVHVVQRSSLLKTGFATHLHPWRLARIYLEAEDSNGLSRLVPVGKTLWSELTPLGRRRLRQE